MQHQTHPADYIISHQTTKNGEIEFTTRRLYQVVEYAVNNTRKAVSDRKSGVYVTYSPSGYTTDKNLPKADCIIIHSSGLLEIVPHNYDICKYVQDFDSTVRALEFVFDSYPEISALESVIYSSEE